MTVLTSWLANMLLLSLAITTINCQLVVNVKNNGGDVYRENIEANITQDTIILEFRKADGTLVTQFIDGRNEIQIFRVVILPEEELGQTLIQTMCFVLRFNKNEFISSDAMSKLRQKNPSTVRHPEESRPTESFDLDLLVNVGASHVVSAHISEMCKEATSFTYTRDVDLHQLSQILNRDYSILQSITEPAPVANLTSCSDILFESQSSLPCLCHYDVCVGWYPCGLKYCRGKDSAGRIVSYRCGIKTCSRCRRFEFRVVSKSHCVWDEPEFQLQSEADADADEDVELRANDGNVADAVPNDSQPKVEGEARQAAVGDQAVREAGAVNSQHNDGLVAAVKTNQKTDAEINVAVEPSVMPASRFTDPTDGRHGVNLASSLPLNMLDDDEDGE